MVRSRLVGLCAWCGMEGGGGGCHVAELEIGEDDRHLAARDEQDQEDESEESEDVVETLQPDRRHDEVELDEDGAKRQDWRN